MASLREMLLSFGVDIQGREKLDALEVQVNRTTGAIKTLAEAAAGIAIFKGIENFLVSTAQMGAKVYDLANSLGVSTQDLQQFQFAAEMVGVSGEKAGNALRFFERHVGQAELGVKSATKDFAALGINIKDAEGNTKPLGDLLPEVADKFAGLESDTERAALAAKLFGRNAIGLVPLLRGGEGSLASFYEQFHKLGLGLKDDFLVEAKKADRQIRILGFAFDAMKSRIAISLLPALTDGVTKLMEFFVAIQHVLDTSYAAKTAIIALSVAAIAALAPLLLAIAPVVAAATALYLIFDDVFTLFEGGHSAVGDLMDSLFGVGTQQSFVKEVKEDVKLLIDFVKEAYGEWTKFKTSLGLGDSPFLRMIQITLGNIMEIIRGLAVILQDPFSADAWKNAGKGIMDVNRHIAGQIQKEEETAKERENNEFFDKFSKGLVDKNGKATPGTGAMLLRQQESPSTFSMTAPGNLLTDTEARGAGMNNNVEVNVNVQGGATNEETGKTVARSAEDGTAQALRKAHAAVKARR